MSQSEYARARVEKLKISVDMRAGDQAPPVSVKETAQLLAQRRGYSQADEARLPVHGLFLVMFIARELPRRPVTNSADFPCTGSLQASSWQTVSVPVVLKCLLLVKGPQARQQHWCKKSYLHLFHSLNPCALRREGLLTAHVLCTDTALQGSVFLYTGQHFQALEGSFRNEALMSCHHSSGLYEYIYIYIYMLPPSVIYRFVAFHGVCQRISEGFALKISRHGAGEMGGCEI